MIFHPEEYERARLYWQNRDFPHISTEQRARILEKGKHLIGFHLRYPFAHHLISLSVFAVIFSLDYCVLLRLGRNIKDPVFAGLAIGLFHAFLMYSLAVYTLHEGAAHKLIVVINGKLSALFSLVANNISRITLAESDYYARNHLSHHAHFTTPQDDEFLNFISAKRFYSVFLPFASIFNFSDFKAHTGLKYTSSRIFSLMLTFLYNFTFALLMRRYYSWLTIFIALVIIFPNVAFWLDRMRQYTEHNLMPLNTVDGARDLGTGFWGMLFGGGPWGQPCHWSHHLYPGIPWYNQLVLHRFVKRMLTSDQKKVFMLKPVFGFPGAFLGIVRITSY